MQTHFQSDLAHNFLEMEIGQTVDIFRTYNHDQVLQLSLAEALELRDWLNAISR